MGIQQLRGQNFAIFWFPLAWTGFISWAWKKADIHLPLLPHLVPVVIELRVQGQKRSCKAKNRSRKAKIDFARPKIDLGRPEMISQIQKLISQGQKRSRKAKNWSRKGKNDLARPKTISQGQKSISQGLKRSRKAKNWSRKAKIDLARPKLISLRYLQSWLGLPFLIGKADGRNAGILLCIWCNIFEKINKVVNNVTKVDRYTTLHNWDMFSGLVIVN